MAIEFSRDITFGQYLDLRSPIHRLDPRTKIVAFGTLMLATFLTGSSFAGLAVIVAAAALIQGISRIPLSYALRGMRLLVNTMLIIFVFQVLFYPSPSESGTLWRWGILSISTDGVRQGLVIIVRVVLLYYFTSTLMFTTALMDLADGLEIMLDPLKRVWVPVNELVMVAVIAIKFVPLLVAELERLIKAQTARGARFDQGGPIQRTRKLGAVLIPLFVNAFSRAEVLTTAMNARCYRGGRGRTKRRVLTFQRADALAFAIVLIFACGAVVASRAAAF
jgi:energy-coupling factor transport system permease protein